MKIIIGQGLEIFDRLLYALAGAVAMVWILVAMPKSEPKPDAGAIECHFTMTVENCTCIGVRPDPETTKGE